MKEIITLNQLYSIAKQHHTIDGFKTHVGKLLGIPSTDARCNDIELSDLIQSQPKQEEEDLRNCNRAGTSPDYCNLLGKKKTCVGCKDYI